MRPAVRQMPAPSQPTKFFNKSMIDINLTQDGSEGFLLKNLKVTYDEDGHLLLGPLLANISQIGGFEFDGQ